MCVKLAIGGRFLPEQGPQTRCKVAGVIFQLRRAQISAGSTNPAIASDRSGGALQILGIPGKSVYFTSYNEQSSAANTNIGTDTNPFTTTPSAGDWGGIHNVVKATLDPLIKANYKDKFGAAVGYLTGEPTQTKLTKA